MDPGILTKLLQTFIGVFSGGAVHLADEAFALLRNLATIEILLMALWATYTRDNLLLLLMGKVLTFGALTYLIQYWPKLTTMVINSFIGAGLLAGGDGISLTDFTDPSTIAYFGLSVTGVIFARITEYAGLDALKNIVEILFSGFAALATTLAYFTLAIWIFVTLLEFYAVSAITVILVPFGMWSKTAFLCEKAIAAIFSSGVQVLTLSFITSATLPVMVRLQPKLHPDFQEVMLLLLGALAILGLSFRANKLTQLILHGTPHFGVADVQQFTQSVTRTLATVTHTMVRMRDAIQPGSNPTPRRR